MGGRYGEIWGDLGMYPIAEDEREFIAGAGERGVHRGKGLPSARVECLGRARTLPLDVHAALLQPMCAQLPHNHWVAVGASVHRGVEDGIEHVDPEDTAEESVGVGCGEGGQLDGEEAAGLGGAREGG